LYSKFINVLFAILLLVSCVKHNTTSQSDAVAASQKNVETAPVPVSASIVRVDTLTQYISTSGTIQPLHTIKILSQIPGEISGVFVSNGMKVESGTVLLQLDNSECRDELIRARSEYFEALNAALQELRINHTSHLDTINAYFHAALNQKSVPQLPGLIAEKSPQPVVLTTQEYMILTRHQVPAKDAAVHRAERNLRHCTIRAPFSGVISGLSVASGAVINSNTETMTLTTLDSVQIAINILEDELGLLKAGTPFRIISSDGRFVFSGTIEGLSPQVDRDTHTGKAFAFLPNPRELWKAGQYVQVEVQQAIYPNQLIIPREAVLTRNDRNLVFVVKHKTAKWHYVTLGPSNSRFVSIKKGVLPGDTVVVSGHYSLAHDSPVDVQMMTRNKTHRQQKNSQGLYGVNNNSG